MCIVGKINALVRRRFVPTHAVWCKQLAHSALSASAHALELKSGTFFFSSSSAPAARCEIFILTRTDDMRLVVISINALVATWARS
jgi:hypothetical protein